MLSELGFRELVWEDMAEAIAAAPGTGSHAHLLRRHCSVAA
jgi:hypothetical protein